MCSNATLTNACFQEEAWTVLGSSRSPLVCGAGAFFADWTCVGCAELYVGRCRVCDKGGCIDRGGAHVVI